tara:strand:+ start:291 stop:560 length:270 start_codon:yes stop_codon:yes gene_type:complete
MTLTSREGFIAWFTAFQMAHTVTGVDPEDLNREFIELYHSVMDTMWKSKYADLTLEEIEEIMEDINMELMKTRDIMSEAIEQDRLGERV